MTKSEPWYMEQRNLARPDIIIHRSGGLSNENQVGLGLSKNLRSIAAT